MENWQELLRSASQLRAAGRVREAIAAYQRLLAAKPDLPDSWYNLGWLQRQARQYDEALRSYSRALDLGISGPEEVHLNRAVIFSDHLHRPEEARRELESALAKKPDYVPALLNLGNLHEDLGDREQARSAYARALELEPANALALARLAMVSLSSELDQKLEARIRSAIARGSTGPGDEATLGFALGALLDAAARYDDAFAAYSAANEASRVAAGPAAAYDPAAHERFIDGVIRSFDRPAAGAGVRGGAPLFICGMFRSGSTLVEQILASHSGVAAGGELDLIPALVQRIAGYPESAAGADATEISNWREFYLSALPAQPTSAQRVTDKRPDNFLHIGLIKTIFPDARIVHTRRNPLDNLLSVYFLHLDPSMAYALTLQDAVHYYRQYHRLMEHWKALYPGDILDVDYDQLVREPRPVVEQLLGFCGLEWQDAVLDFHRTRSAVKTASVWQVREPLHSRSSGRWRNYERYLSSVRRSLPAG